ncbi:PAS domain S-box protein [Leptolyngbya ohadii]|uniref:PAS domain S-box protein n=1 Tax=Leptolyngbya ohadii TaxID=1962290 RepID=UPI000B59EAEE|nr:PAS domain S-box protein [Leptolyngbya ohadii]
MSSLRYLTNLKIDSAQIPLRWMLVVPFVLLTTGATALVGYFSYQAGQQAIETLANQLLQQTSERVSDRLSSYLQEPQQVVAANQLSAKQGMLNLSNPEQLRQQLWQHMALNPALPANAFWRDRGIGLTYGRILSQEEQTFATRVTGKPIPMKTLYFSVRSLNQRQFYSVDSQGKPQQLLYTAKGDFSNLDWYKQAKSAGQQHWTPVSISAIVPALQVMAVAPAYDSAGKFQGLFTSTYLLPEISRFLHTLHFSPGGQLFIVERSGKLIATSDPSEASATAKVNGKPVQLSAIDSQNPVLRSVSQRLLQQFNTLSEIQTSQQVRLRVEGQQQFVQVTPYRDNYGLDWLVVTTIPESDFMTRIQTQNAWTALLCLGTLAATSALGVLAARRITDPLGQLSLAADRIAQNQFDYEVPVTGLGEVKQLSESFRQMAEQLRLSFQLRTDYEQELKQQVTRRTAELAQARDLREVIFNESTDAIFLVSTPPSTLIVDCNQRAVAMFERASKAELIGTLGTSLQKHPFTQEEVNTIGSDVAKKGYWSREIEYITQSGKSFWANLAAKPITVAGETMHLIRLTDISDRKQLELALQESESRTKDILNSVIAGIARMRVFENGNWIIDQVSAGTELLCGYSAEALTQDSHLWLSLINSEDWQACADRVFAHIFAGTTYTYEYRLRHREGHLRWVSQTNNSTWDEVQQCWNLTAISVDITDRKQAELALQQSEAALREAQRVAHVGSWEHEVATQTTFWSEELYRIYQCDSHQPPPNLEEVVTRFVHPEDRAVFESFVARLTQAQPAEQDFRIRLADGSTRYITAKGEPVFDRAGNMARLMGTTLDVTDRKLSEQKLAASEARFQKIAATLPGVLYTSMGRTDSPLVRFTYISAFVTELLEVPPEAIVADPNVVFEMFHPDDTPGYTAAYLQSVAILEPFYYEWRCITPSGKIKWVQTYARPEALPNQDVLWFGVALDVTDRKRVEEERRQAAAALQQSEARLQHLATHVPGVLYTVVIPPDGMPYFEYVSAAVEEIHELTQEQAYADFSLIYRQFHPEDIEDYDAIAGYCAANLTPFVHEWRIITPSGRLKWLHAESLLEQRENGNVAAHGIIQDVTNRKQIELALQQKTEELDRFFTVALDLLCIADTSGCFRRLNQQWEETLGYSLAELEGNRFLDFVHPDDVEKTLSEISILADQNISLNFVNRYRCHDGSYRWIEWRSFPVGNLIYAAARDITDRRQTELALRQSERKFKGAFDTITAGMALVSLAGGFQEVNDSLCQMLDYSAEELLALRLQDIVHPEDHKLGLAAMEQMMAGEIPGYQVEKRFLRREGHSVWGLLNLALMRDPDDRPLYLIAQIVDMSERHRLDVIKDEFISVVSHELRTPLTSIRGSLGLLNAGVLNDEPETAQQMLNLALRSTDRLVRLVNDILDLERLESGKAVLMKEVCCITDLMEQAIDAVQVLADQASVELQLDPLAAQIQAAPDAIVQTLTNLLSNAIKFSPAGGTVWLKAELWAGEQGSGGAGEQGSRGAGEAPIYPLTHPPIHPSTHPPIHSSPPTSSSLSPTKGAAFLQRS